MPVLALKDAFTARAIAVMWNKYENEQGIAPYLGRSFFATDKQESLDLKFIKGRKGLPVSLKAAAFDAQAPLRDAIGFKSIQNEMPFFREGYLVTEKEEQDYATFANAEASDRANQILKEIAKNPLDLIQGAGVVPERMIWQLMAPADGIPKISMVADGGDTFTIDYTDDNGTEYKASNYVSLSGTSLWSAPATAKPLADLVALQEKGEDKGIKLTQFIMNKKTWNMICNAEDTKKQVLGNAAYTAGQMLNKNMVAQWLKDNYDITVIVYNKQFMDESGVAKTFIPEGVVSAKPEGGILGTVTYGRTPEERSGSLTDGSLSIVETGVAVYTYVTNHPINTHCVVSEIVLPTYEMMDNVFILKAVA